MPVIPLQSLTSQSLDAKFANKQRRYATNYSASYLHQPSPPPRLAAPARPPNPTFETLRAAAARLNLPEEHEQPGDTAAAPLPARRHPVRKALLRTTAALALCALAAGGTVAWTVRTPDGGLPSGGVILAAMTQRVHDLTANPAILGVMDEKVATLRQAVSRALAQAGLAVLPVQVAAETPAPRPAPPSASLPLPPGADAQAEPMPAAVPPDAAEVAPAATAQQLVNTFALVRQMGLLVRDMQAENERLHTQLAGATGTLSSRVAGLEQRSAATARDMRDENVQLQAQLAKLADTLQSKALEQRLSPAPAGGPAAAEEPGRPQEAATADAADAAAPGPVRTARDYHVQAASLGVAVLGDANAPQGQASRYLVTVGDQVPGVGRVISITQRGPSWLVLTDHGTIQ